MAGITKKGSDSYLVDRTKLILAYHKNTKEVLFCGTHEGEISGKRVIVEGYSNVNKILLRIQELGLVLPDSISDEDSITKRKVKSFLDINEVNAGGKDVIFSLCKDKNGSISEDSMLEDYQPTIEELKVKFRDINKKKMKKEREREEERERRRLEKEQRDAMDDLMKKSRKDIVT